MVIFVLTYCLPQHQHPAPGVLAIVSLALLGLSRVDQQTPSEERSIDSCLVDQVPQQPQVGLHQQPFSKPLLTHWKGLLKGASLELGN